MTHASRLFKLREALAEQELDAILILQAQTDIDRETKDRILHYNPKALYDL